MGGASSTLSLFVFVWGRGKFHLDHISQPRTGRKVIARCVSAGFLCTLNHKPRKGRHRQKLNQPRMDANGRERRNPNMDKQGAQDFFFPILSILLIRVL